MILFGKFDQFTFGFVLTSVSATFYLGWVNLVLLWNRKAMPILETLPTMEANVCKGCGSEDWTGANMNEAKTEIVNCNKCGGYEGGPK